MATSEHGSVTGHLFDLQCGDRDAVGPLWERYYPQLVRLAGASLRAARLTGAVADGEDVALSAFDSFCRRAEQGRFPDLNDRDGLWRLLVCIAWRKARAEIRRRHPGVVSSGADYEDAVGREPSPEFAARVADQYAYLLDILGDPALVHVAVWRMEGLTVREIMERQGCSRTTIFRRIALIREIWSEALDREESDRDGTPSGPSDISQ
jgi:DNA-directed RNA polymerase specialized sigma24 family protein